MSTASAGPEGAARPARAPGAPSAGATADRGALVVRLDGTVVQTVPLGERAVTIGRLPGNAVVLPHPAVSRHHAEVRAEAAGVLVADLGSAGGTRVDGEPVLPDRPVPLAPGAVLQVGPYECTYVPPRPDPVRLRPPEGARFARDAAEVEADADGVEGAPRDGAYDDGRDDPLPNAQPGRPTFSAPLPAGVRSRYLEHLPGIFQDDGFLGRLLLIFEAIWEPLEQRQDHIALYYDPRTAPAPLLPWLASWLGLALDPHWPEARRRRLLAEAMELYRWRGTPYGLARMLEVAAGVTAEVAEDASEPWVVRVRVTLPPNGDVRPEAVDALVRAHKPAHVGYVLEVTP